MMKLLGRVRVLPVTIFAAALMLSVKVGNVFDGVNSMVGSVPAAVAQEKTPEPPKKAPAPAKPAESKAAPPKGGEPKTAEKSPPPAVNDNPENDPTLFTQSEIDLLQQLAERREALEKQKQELIVREAMFQAVEKRINRKIAELTNLQGVIEKLIKKQNVQEDKKLLSLVKIYENMKPKDAAQIFEELDIDTLLMVAERMKERKLAPIMAIMNPIKAKEMTVELTRMRQLPLPGANTGG